MGAADLEREDADAGARVIWALPRLVGEAAVLDGAALEVADSAVDPGRVDRAAGTLGGAEGHHLPARDADVAVVAVGLVTPAAGVVRALLDVLRLDDHIDGAAQGLLNAVGEGRVGDHAGDLGEHQAC